MFLMTGATHNINPPPLPNVFAKFFWSFFQIPPLTVRAGVTCCCQPTLIIEAVMACPLDRFLQSAEATLLASRQQQVTPATAGSPQNQTL